ncbi:family 2 encapsulin nanocompartment cargo protein polyprenyl transferase [Actinomadura rupiterrae]|uniref:family 2 encapsulin nanocompartment cargo protein polyprenyl transferase n=1 Tax=Actinomadura rupiterrae TaxID=559627 RepID=UPI0020A3B28E|nr:family 2 encapsulin nanocompartment cargo protein polyprenyl transferase [Actinomadura rupiterrae]MCP2334755.1 geranylgeranyl diphosphate synthase type I [Actinomadura rupiterrae]
MPRRRPAPTRAAATMQAAAKPSSAQPPAPRRARGPGGGRAAAPPAGAETLSWARDLIEPELRAAVAAMPDSMARISAYHFGWEDARGRPARADGGKVLRPALVLLCAEAVGGTARAALPAAVAVELVHNFSLLHDDVMDGDLTRRHRPTAWNVFGAGAAILAGDALLARAQELLAASPDAVRVLSRAVLDLVEGQASDVAFERRTDVGLPECVRMAERKTGALIGASCGLGASAGGGSAEQAARLTAFGHRLGLAFQLVDDLLGIWGDPSATGKAAHSDLRSRKKSLPVVAALTSGTKAADELAALYYQDRPLGDDERARAAALVEAAGGRDWARRRADELLTEALTELDAATPTDSAAVRLRELAALVTTRDH